jgi:hypothetical protein
MSSWVNRVKVFVELAAEIRPTCLSFEDLPNEIGTPF